MRTNGAEATSTSPLDVYRTYAVGAFGNPNPLTYQIPVPDGTYTIRLDFVEPGSTTAVGERVFDIKAQGATVVANYDIVGDAG
ncbi:MAG: malectin domain-containing carbohydrate-binding protein, partial [Gemmatimonadales bacterium]